jgi:hypothetical protein
MTLSGREETCSICCTKTSLSNPRTQCPNANCASNTNPDSVICNKCAKRYLLETLVNTDAHCMVCKRGFKHAELYAMFSASWNRGVYAVHRRKLLLERQKAMLPETQERAEIEIRLRTCKNKIAELKRDIRDLKREKNSECRELSALTYNLRNLDEGKSLFESKKRRVFRMRCPKEGCNAFISEEWRCGICGTEVCKSCREILPPDAVKEGETGAAAANVHTCSPEALESIKAIAKDTKQCPSCAVPIFRIGGCSQHWCTHCQTTFDWKTLKIQHGGVIHNPHYFEYRHRVSAAAAAVPPVAFGCDRNQLCLEIGRRVRPFSTFVRGIFHVENVIMVHVATDSTARLLEMRIKYLIGNLSEKEWCKQLLIVERTKEWNEANLLLLDTFVNAGKDIIASYAERCKNERYLSGTEQDQDFRAVEAEITELTAYIRQEATALADAFKRDPSSAISIDNEYTVKFGRYH